MAPTILISPTVIHALARTRAHENRALFDISSISGDFQGSLNNLALFYKIQGDYEQAKSLYQRALAILEKTFGSNHPSTKLVRENLAILLEDMKQKKKK